MGRIATKGIVVAVMMAMAVACTGEPLKIWDYSNPKDVSFSTTKGNKAEIRVVADAKTPNGGNFLEVSLRELQPQAVPHAIQLKFKYEGKLKAGHSYEVSFPCKATKPGTFLMAAALAGQPWTFLPNARKTFETSMEWENICFDFTVKEDTTRPLAIPLVMLAGYGSSAKIFFGPATLWDVADKPKLVVNENQIFNSSFEIDDSGYALAKHLYMPRNPNLKYETAGIIDKTTFVSGKQSLKLLNPYGDEARVYPHEVRMTPDMQYTLSLWLKAEKPGRVRVQMVSDKWSLVDTFFDLTTEWRRYNHTFTTKPNSGNTYLLYIATGLEPEASTASVWIDDIQLDQGVEKPYAPGSDIECICVPDKHYIISKDGKANVSCVLKTINNSRNAAVAKLTVFTVDDYSGKIVFSKDVTLSLKAGERKDYPIDITVPVYGSYITDVKQDSASWLKLRSQVSCFGVIGEYDASKPIDLDKTFCVSFNGPTPFNFYHSALTTKPCSFRASGCSPEEYVKRLSMMGCRLLRDWSSTHPWFSWFILEPEKGKFDFSHADKGVELLARHGISILPILEPTLKLYDYKDRFKFPPSEWMTAVLKNSPVVNGATDTGKMTERRAIPKEHWRRFVKAVVTHFKGKISHYEIFNEPNLFCPSAEFYVGFLESASDEIRKVDSKAKIVGFCSTGDKGGNVEGFFEECFKLGGLKYVDIASWHPYFARELSSRLPADKQIHDIKALLAKYGKPDMPLWNTECYVTYGIGWDYNDIGKAHHVARKFLTDMGEGVAQSISVQEITVWKDVLTPNCTKSFTPRIDSIQALPSANYVAYNALARFFEGARPIGKWRWFDRAICYAYERDDHYIAAFWNYASCGGLQIKLPDDPKNIEIFDMFGNKLPFNGQPLAVGIAPQYIKWKSGSATSVKASLDNVVIGGEKPFHIARSLILRGTGTALLSVRNQSGKTIGNASIAIKGGGEKFETGTFATMEVKVAKIPVRMPVGKLEVEIFGAEENFASIEIPEEVNYLPLEEGRSKAVLPIEKQVIGKPGSPEDLSAEFTVGYAGDTLNIKVKVKDDKRCRLVKDIWEEDAIQIYIDTFPMHPGPNYPKYSPTTYKIEISAWRNGKDKVNSNGFPGKIQAVTTELVNGYELDVSMSFAAIPGFKLKGGKIGFDLSVEDSDANRRKSELVWSGTATNYYDCSRFGIIEFK